MTKVLECVVPGCRATFRSQSDAELVAREADHAARVHDLRLTPALVEKAKKAIRVEV